MILLFFIYIVTFLLIVVVIKFTINSLNKKIPRIIYQTYPGNVDDDIPESIKTNIEYLKKMNPGWKYKLFRDDEIEDFILKEYNLEYYRLYKKINDDYGAAKADFFRYLLIYKKGGVYLDIKSSADKPLDDIIKHDDEYILSYWKDKKWKDSYNHPNGEIQQWYIISKPNHEYLKETIDNVVDNIINYDRKDLGVGGLGTLNTTGPIVYTKSIVPIMNNYNHTLYPNEVPGLVFKKIKNHHKLFQKHYSQLKSPIIL